MDVPQLICQILEEIFHGAPSRLVDPVLLMEPQLVTAEGRTEEPTTLLSCLPLAAQCVESYPHFPHRRGPIIPTRLQGESETAVEKVGCQAVFVQVNTIASD